MGCPAPPAVPTTPTAPLSEGDYALTVDQVPLAYHVRGHGPVCIVHPGGPGLDWGYLRMPEVERVMTLVYLEPVGTGLSSRLASIKEYTYARYAQLLDLVRAELGLAKVCVIGHSHGGMVAVHWAASHADRVAGLVLYDTAARSDKETHEDQQSAAQAFAQEPWFAPAMAAFARQPKIASDAEAEAAIRDAIPGMFADWTHRQAEFATWAQSVRAVAGPIQGSVANQAPWDLRGKLSTVQAPVLILVGAKDWITPPVRSDELVHAIPGAKLVLLASSGHMGHVEEPAAFAAAISELARRLAAPPSAPAS